MESLTEPGKIEAKYNTEWPTGGQSCGTPDPGRQANLGSRREGTAQHAFKHIEPHPGDEADYVGLRALEKSRIQACRLRYAALQAAWAAFLEHLCPSWKCHSSRCSRRPSCSTDLLHVLAFEHRASHHVLLSFYKAEFKPNRRQRTSRQCSDAAT